MALKDKLVQSDITARQLYPSRPSYTLTDLRNDDEFVQTAERYLKSINQGEDVDDLFQYFRGVDFNLYDAHRAWKDSKDFTEDQKKDYLYLENKFRNAKVGGFKEKAQLGIDVAQEIVSDPTILASALFIPWSGGASIGGRVAAGAAAKAGLKTMVADQIKKSPLPKGLLTGGQFLKQPLTNKQTYAVLAAEGFGYGGTYDYVMQGRELELGQREGIDLGQTAASATITGVASPLIYGGAKQLFKVPSKIRNIEEQRLANIDHNENYKPTLIEKGTEKFYNVVGNYGGMILKPTTPLLPKAKISELLSTLLKKFRYDAEEGIMPKDIGLQEKLLNDYNARLGALGGVYKERVEKILKKYELFSYNKKNLALPFTAGHFLNPFRSKTIKTRKSLTYNRSLSDEVNNDLAYYLRSGKNKIVDILPDGTKQTRKLDENIIKAGKEIKPLLEDMIFRASESGLNVGYIKGFFPRFWRTDVIRNNKDEFIEKIMKQEDVPYEKAFEIWEELSTLKTGKATSGFNITSRLEKTRALKNINDEDFGKFLNNDVQGVLGDYFLDAAKIITRAEMFGADIKAFRKNWIRPIQRELGKNRLSDRQVQYLEDLYYYTTGIKGQIDTSKPFRRAGQFLSDFLTVSMQTSLLGFSALTSLSEIGVPLLKGAPVKEGWNSIRKATVDSANEWWDKQKVSFGPYLNDIGKEFKRDPNLDIRSQNRQELNAFLKSLDVGAEDRLMAIYGQAIGKNFTKVQNAFFRTVGLYDWTRFVQLVGYDLGKSIIYRNLKAIDDLNKGIIKQTNKNKVNAARLGDELKELGIDIDDGLKWINRGAKHTDAYYEQYVRQAAARYTDEVVMNPTAASAQKPLLHSRAGTKWIFGLTGFPTAFSNTVLRNVAKNLARDGKTMYVGGTKVSGLHAMTAAMFMTQIGILNYTIRTQGRNLKEYEEGTLTAEEMVLRGMAYSGLLGPAEIPYRYEQAIEYESKIYAAITAGVGPNVPDLVNYVHAVATRGAVLETVLKRAPFAAAVKSTNPEIFDKALQEVREIDKEYFGPAKSEKKTEFEPFAKGGLVGEETIEGPKVPFTKENAAERINPYTGEPYRVPLSAGGSLASKLASKITSSYTKADQELLDSLQKKAQQNIKEVQLKTKDGKEISYDVSKAQKTQIVGTKGTYDKAAEIKKDLGYTGKDVLDYGSGMQLNYAKNILDAETFEPFPKLDKADEIGIPDYIVKEEIKKQYDFITSFSVLNTIPPVERSEAVLKIGESLKPNGTALITARPLSSVKTAKAKTDISSSELINTSGMYQKGYSPKELGQYLLSVLGDEFEVFPIPSKYGLSGEGVLLRKKGESRTPFKQGGPTNSKLENFKNVVDKVIGEYETKEEYVVKLNDALNPFMERTFPRGVELLKRDLVDHVFGGEDEISFKNKVEKNVVTQNKNSAMNIISQDFQRKINLSQPGWNPSKTASVLKGDLSFMKSERVKLNLGGQLAVRAITPKKVAKVNPGISKTDLRTGVYPMTVSQRRLEADPAFEGFTVYHGSPFNFQKFEAGDKLLTGEGANAFGKGLYFTENESIAKTYRQQLTKKHELDRLNKETKDLENKLTDIVEKDNFDPKNPTNEFKSIVKELGSKTQQQIDIRDKKIDVSDRGTLYEAKVRTSPYHLVDWDKKIADQPVRIIDSFNKIIETLDNTQLNDLINALNNYPAWTRDDTVYSRQQLIFDAIYHVSETKSQDVIPILNRILNLRNLKNDLKNPQTKSKKIYVEDMLKEDGVQGIRYFDGFSRKGKSKRQRNYVIFDPRIIEISKKYAVPIPLAGKLLMEMDKERENEI